MIACHNVRHCAPLPRAGRGRGWGDRLEGWMGISRPVNRRLPVRLHPAPSPSPSRGGEQRLRAIESDVVPAGAATIVDAGART